MRAASQITQSPEQLLQGGALDLTVLLFDSHGAFPTSNWFTGKLQEGNFIPLSALLYRKPPLPTRTVIRRTVSNPNRDTTNRVQRTEGCYHFTIKHVWCLAWGPTFSTCTTLCCATRVAALRFPWCRPMGFRVTDPTLSAAAGCEAACHSAI